jgi:hypothetical protein
LSSMLLVPVLLMTPWDSLRSKLLLAATHYRWKTTKN